MSVIKLFMSNKVGRNGGTEERRNGGTEERRNGGTEERRNGGTSVYADTADGLGVIL